MWFSLHFLMYTQHHHKATTASVSERSITQTLCYLRLLSIIVVQKNSCVFAVIRLALCFTEPQSGIRRRAGRMARFSSPRGTPWWVARSYRLVCDSLVYLPDYRVKILSYREDKLCRVLPLYCVLCCTVLYKNMTNSSVALLVPRIQFYSCGSDTFETFTHVYLSRSTVCSRDTWLK